MSELILHAAHLSEAHQLRFSYLFDVAAKRLRDNQPDNPAKPATELWVVDANSAPEAISKRPDTACVLLIATDDQADALRGQWPNQIDAQLPPDYSVNRLTQMLEHISVQAHGKRLRETLKNRRLQGMTLPNDVRVKNADAAFLKATDVATPAAPVAVPAPVAAPAEPAAVAATTHEIEPASSAPSEVASGTRFRIKRWTQLTGSMAGQTYRQLLAAMISSDRTVEELMERSDLERADILRLLQVLRGKGVLTEIAPMTAADPIVVSTQAQAAPAAAFSAPAAAATPSPSLARGLFRQLSRWIGQNRNTTHA